MRTSSSSDLLVRRAQLSDKAKYSRLTFPSYRDRFHQLEDPRVKILIAETNNGTPVGLIVADIEDQKSRVLCLRSIFIEPAYRKREIATAFLTEAIQDWLQSGYRVTTVWTGKLKQAQAFERLLARCNFTGFFDRIFFFEGYAHRVASADWFSQFKSQPTGAYQIVSWSEQPVSQKTASSLGAPEILSPNFRMEFIEPSASKVLLCNGKPIGWQLVHQFEEKLDGLSYSRCWVHADHRSQARGLRLIAHCIATHATERPDRPIGYFEVMGDNQRMLNLYHRHLVPNALRAYSSRQAWVRPHA